jgi:hypothetical protein
MTKQAERPITVSFIDDSSCTFDSNDFVEFEILTHDLPMGEIVFNGMPYNTGLTELGRCVFDYCDHGLYVYQELANMLYEAQHPWLDWEDALSQVLFNDPKIRKMELLIKNNYGIISAGVGEAFVGKYATFKPIKPFDFHHFKQVKVYTP